MDIKFNLFNNSKDPDVDVVHNPFGGDLQKETAFLIRVDVNPNFIQQTMAIYGAEASPKLKLIELLKKQAYFVELRNTFCNSFFTFTSFLGEFFYSPFFILQQRES